MTFKSTVHSSPAKIKKLKIIEEKLEREKNSSEELALFKRKSLKRNESNRFRIKLISTSIFQSDFLEFLETENYPR